MLVISSPIGFKEERKYAFRTLFEEFLHIPYVLTFEERADFAITCGDDGRSLHVVDAFHNLEDGFWLRDGASISLQMISYELDELESMPRKRFLPALIDGSGYGNVGIEFEEKQIAINFDIVDSSFYILSRMEEFLSIEKDVHNRFPAFVSHAFRNGYLDRPVVNEYVEILWACLKKLWPSLRRRNRSFEMHLTHDVDLPFLNMIRSPGVFMRSLARDLVKRRDVLQFLSRVKSGFYSNITDDWRDDPFNTFDRIMDISERHGQRSSFFFIPESTHRLDGNYRLKHPEIMSLMKRAARRGHELGYHGSYSSFQDRERIKREIRQFRRISEFLIIKQEKWGGRQHYLRWQPPMTWRYYADAGLDYDTTLSFADRAGFRCGTCYEFPVYDLEQRKSLSLKERPLIVMDCTVLDEQYMNLTVEEAYDYVSRLKNNCRLYGGDFTILWHNSQFLLPGEVELYEQILMA